MKVRVLRDRGQSGYLYYPQIKWLFWWFHITDGFYIKTRFFTRDRATSYAARKGGVFAWEVKIKVKK